jgi:APA family basic amino acid/polyamine antiporter
VPDPGSRPLTLSHATALVVANMVGTGVFTTSGLVLGELGSPLVVLAVWAAAGLFALAGAAVYAELGAMLPRAGGEYVYLSRAFHPAFGFLSGWIALVVGFAAPSAANALAFGDYLHLLAPAVPARPAALALVGVTTVLHARDVRRGGLVQAALTALTVTLVLVFTVAGAASVHADWHRLGATTAIAAGSGTPVGAAALAVSLVYVSYSYFGWNAAAYVAGEVRDPHRTLPRALVGGTAAVTALYLALNAVLLAAAPGSALAGKMEVARIAAQTLFGPRGATALSLAVTLALAGSVSAFTLVGPRIVQVMAQDGAFFRALGRTGARGAPTAAVLLQGALAAAGVLTAAFGPLVIYAGFTLTLSSAAAVTAAFVLRRREPELPRPHRALGWPVSGLAYLALAAYMIAFAVRERPRESLAALATLAAGGISFVIWRRRGRAPGRP